LLKRVFLYLFCFLFIYGNAQTRKRTFRQRELGFFAGASYYIGDINPRGHFFTSRPAGGIFFRYSTTYRYAFRFGFNYGQIRGNDADSKEADQRERNLNFKSNIYELNATSEFNFVEYRIGNDRYRFTLFVFAGMSAYYFNPLSNVGGSYEPLREKRTEDQGKTYPKFQVSIGRKMGTWHRMGPPKNVYRLFRRYKRKIPCLCGNRSSGKQFSNSRKHER
jgi:hypothetical protein